MLVLVSHQLNQPIIAIYRLQFLFNTYQHTLDQILIQNSRLRFSTFSGWSLLAAVRSRMADKEPAWRRKKALLIRGV